MGENIDIKNCSDTELVLKFRDTRDNAIIGELFQRYTHLVFGVCMKYLKDEDAAKDGVMQIFEKILTDLHRHNVDNFKGWIYMVAKNHCMMYFRSKKNHVELPRELSNDSNDYNSEDGVMSPAGGGQGGGFYMELTSNLHHNGEDKEKQLTLMESVIKELKEDQKICIELFYLQEKSYEDVAKMTGYSMKEVKSYIQNGKRNLKILMTQGVKKASNILLFFITISLFCTGNNLADTSWRLFSVQNIKSKQVQYADISCGISLIFNNNGEYYGHDGCNAFNGKYSLEGDNNILMNKPIQTMRYCVPENCKIGETLHNEYPAVNQYSVDNDAFVLWSKGVKIVFKKSNEKGK